MNKEWFLENGVMAKICEHYRWNQERSRNPRRLGNWTAISAQGGGGVELTHAKEDEAETAVLEAGLQIGISKEVVVLQPMGRRSSAVAERATRK